jgi:hypothetical protein
MRPTFHNCDLSITAKMGCSRVSASGQQKSFHCRGPIKLPLSSRRPILITEIGGVKV